MKRLFYFLIPCLLTAPLGIHAADTTYWKWETLPDLIPAAGENNQPGLAGAYAGVDQDVLLLAGGANFPEALPWKGGTKVYQDEVYILNPDTSWSVATTRLPSPIAYGAAISTRYGMLMLGGMDSEACSGRSYFLRYLPESQTVAIHPAPDLPVPLANFAAAVVDGQLYISGGQEQPNGPATQHFYVMDLKPDSSEWAWKSLPSWPGPPRAYCIAAAQSNGTESLFYLFSGRNFGPDQPIQVLDDAYAFSPRTQSWISLHTDSTRFPVMAGTVFPIGHSHLVFPSGADGRLLEKGLSLQAQVDSIKLQINASSNSSLEESLELGLKQAESALRVHLNEHPGFGNRVWMYHTLTGRLYEGSQFPGSGSVTTTAVVWNGNVVIPSGEIRPGVRTAKVWQAVFPTGESVLTSLDYGVIAFYFLILAGMGVYFATRQHSVQDYFKGGNRIPWWAAGLSIFGTGLSAITFMAIPAKTYATDWAYFFLGLTIFGVAPLIAAFFVPFYRKLDLTSAYEYLEQRFNLLIRVIGSLSFILFQIGRMGIVLYLPALALNVVSGVDIFLSIGLMGLISLLYTLLGGIEAVIWTDVMQVIVLMGGAVLSLVMMALSVDGGLPGIVEIGVESAKFNLVNLDLTLREPTLWVVLIGGLFINLTTYGTDQTIVQRYLTTRDVATAKRTVWTNAWLSLVSTGLFFFLGTALFAFYHEFPQQLSPTLSNTDAIFPWYIVSQLPSGISGLLIAGIFAAAMSSLSSSMNSVATAYSTDIHFRFQFKMGGSQLAIARWATLVAGIAGTLFAILMATSDIQSLWDEFQKVLGLILGSLGGLFLLGMLTKRANSSGALIGIIGSVIVQYIVGYYQPVHLLLYSTTGVISCFVLGWLASGFFSSSPQSSEKP